MVEVCDRLGERLAVSARCETTRLALNVIPALQKCGRCRIDSGKTAPSGLTGSAAFDPSETSTADKCEISYPTDIRG